MLSRVKCVAFKGLEVVEVAVEVNINPRGLPSFDIVGLPNKSVEESRHRIKAAFINSGFEFPDRKITINLAPADLNKSGSFYDLPVAVGIFCAQNNVNVNPDWFFFGELSLDGSVKNTKGSFLLLDHVHKLENAVAVVPSQNLATSFKNSNIYEIGSLKELFESLDGGNALKKLSTSSNEVVLSEGYDVSIDDVIGQESAKRAIEISAAGLHNLMLVGSPGTGKTMLAKSILSILPPLTKSEQIEVQRIYSYAGKQGIGFLQRPFRNPHHTISYAGMIGGGTEPSPGEISLAHNGVLFMDEFCEFSRNVLESLRQPMQDGQVTLSRSNVSYTFPSKFALIAAANPCPCGYLGHSTRACICTEQKIYSYAKKLTGPLADRFDLFTNVYPESSFIQTSTCKTNSVETLREKVKRAHEFEFELNPSKNSYNILTDLNKECKGLLNSAYKKLNLSPRAYFKTIKVARTIANLNFSSDIKVEYLAEALQYRQK